MCALVKVVIANNAILTSTGDPQDPNSPCACLCRVVDEPLPTDLSNQVLTGALRYDFGRLQEIHDRASADQFREIARFAAVRAQSSGSDGDKSKKKTKYTDAKKSSRPRESLEQVKISQIEWHGDWWIR
eukprot:2799403-Amphidinium_carterae.1